ncbi:hypothetical protein E3P81_01821 [Wallemia ichthyophaga]|nr:hypothetical protein E3P97_01820 [Wallemia ichthyophaga]TIB33276.1 hypothetical protein E3P85_01474 [Wallemia ichthyophaga]TIB47303.1 hypothetical protein E3P82_01820 [Wallemia ichthyophaga]TIB51609.1 hypothetical protein E3P81_01821 [Wallemia ichthyophaga]TIB54297.1 hypothetical protein E3P80_01821 [Wallemia ichthyophaga]
MPTKPSDLRLNIPNSSANISPSLFPSSTPSRSQLLNVPPASPSSSRKLDPNSISAPITNPSSPNPSTHSHTIHHSPRVHRTFHKLASSKPGNSSKYNQTSPSFSHAPATSNSAAFGGSGNSSSTAKGGLGKDIASAIELHGDSWQAICVKVLPLFNGENMITSLEDLNALVIIHIRDTIARSKPSRVIESLSTDFNNLISIGMLTLRAKLVQHVDESTDRFATRTVEIWTFFFGQVLPLLEGVFLPYSTDTHIQALAKSSTANSAKTGDGSSHNLSYNDESTSKVALLPSVMNVRKSVIKGFRDQLIIPLFGKLERLFMDLCDEAVPVTPTSGPQSKQSLSSLKSAYQSIPDSLPSTAAAIAASSTQPKTSAFSPIPRLQQMSLVVSSIRASDTSQDRVERLGRIIRRSYIGDVQNEQSTSSSGTSLLFRSTQRTSSISPFTEKLLNKRRDRRGWIRKKTNANASSTDDHLDDGGSGMYEAALGREATQKDSEDEWLDTLRSPTETVGNVSTGITPTVNTQLSEKQPERTAPIIAPRGSSLAFGYNVDDVSSSDEDEDSGESNGVEGLRRVETEVDLEQNEKEVKGGEYNEEREGRSSDDKTQETVVQERSPVEDSLRRWDQAQKELEEMLGMTEGETPKVSSEERWSKPLPPSPKLLADDSLIVGSTNQLQFQSYRHNTYNNINLDFTPKQILQFNNSLVMLDTDGVLYHLNGYNPQKSNIRNVIKLLQSSNSIVVIRQSSIGRLKLSPRLTVINELPLPSLHLDSAINNDVICLADTANTYSLLNLTNSVLLPLLPFEGSPSITSIDDADEFLMITHNDLGAVGVFIDSYSGEPKHGPLQFPSTIKSIVHQSPHLFTLLSNNTLQIHSTITHSLIHSLSLSHLHPMFLQSTPLGLSIPQSIPNQLHFVSFPLLNTSVDYSNASNRPSNSSSQLESTQVILATDTGSIHAFIPPSIFDQSIYLLDMENDNARQQALSLANSLPTDSLESYYIHLYAALQLFRSTSFSDASALFSKSQCDIRLILSWFPDLTAGLFDPDEFVKIPLGIANLIENIPRTIKDLIVGNLEKNYSPYLNVESDEPVRQLYDSLMENARSMLLECLSKEHRRRRRARQATYHESESYTDMILDTCLAIIFAERSDKDRNALNVFINNSNNILLPIAEPWFTRYGRYAALSRLYESHGDIKEAIKIHKRFIEQTIVDKDVVDPLRDIIRLLNRVEEADLLLEYGLWLILYDRNAGLQVLSSHPRTSIDEGILLEALGRTDKVAEQEYLEILVLARNREDTGMRQALLDMLIGNVVEALKDSNISGDMWRLIEEYKLQKHDQSYAQYVTAVLDTTEISPMTKNAIISRLKLLLFLQMASDLDWNSIETALHPFTESTLLFEKAVILGKLEQHSAALNILARNLRDTFTSQHYCAFPGYILSGSLARKCIDNSHLSNCWLVALARTSMVAVAPPLRSHLLRILLDVYMADGDVFSAEIASLLGSQALHLNFLETLPRIPNDTPLISIKDFMLRQLRRTEHKKRELSILKGVAAAENLTKTEEAWLATREAGAIIEEAIDDANQVDGNDK